MADGGPGVMTERTYPVPIPCQTRRAWPVRLPFVLDVRRVRSDLDGVKAELARRHDAAALRDLDELVALDARQRELTTEREAIRAQVKTLSNEVRNLRQAGDTDGAEAKQRESRTL